MKADDSILNPHEVPDATNADFENVKNEKNLVSSFNGSKLLLNGRFSLLRLGQKV